MTPVETVVSFVLEVLGGISLSAGYGVDIGLVELKSRMIRDLNEQDLPAVLLSLGLDDFDREEMGGDSGNAEHRALDLLLTVRALEDDPEAIVPGEKVRNAIIKALRKNRSSSNGRLPAMITVGAVGYNEFERIASNNKIGDFKIPIRAHYIFTLEDL